MTQPPDTDPNRFNAAVRQNLDELDGSDRAAVRLLTGLNDSQLDDLGGC